MFNDGFFGGFGGFGAQQPRYRQQASYEEELEARRRQQQLKRQQVAQARQQQRLREQQEEECCLREQQRAAAAARARSESSDPFAAFFGGAQRRPSQRSQSVNPYAARVEAVHRRELQQFDAAVAEARARVQEARWAQLVRLHGAMVDGLAALPQKAEAETVSEPAEEEEFDSSESMKDEEEDEEEAEEAAAQDEGVDAEEAADAAAEEAALAKASLETVERVRGQADELESRWEKEAFVACTAENREEVVKARRYFSEGLLLLVIKLDAVATHGDMAVRKARKAAINEVEHMVEELRLFGVENDAA